MKLCTHCRVSHLITTKSITYTQSRSQITISAPLPLKKETKHRPKRFTELLEVSDGSIINRKATIRKMNPTQLSLFVNKSDINTNDLFKIDGSKLLEFSSSDAKESRLSSNRIHKMNEENKPNVGCYIVEKNDVKFRKIDHVSVIEDLQSSGMSDSASLIKSSSMLNSISKADSTHELEEENETSATSVMNVKAENKQKSTRNENKDMEVERLKKLQEKARKDSLTRALDAYLRVCVSCGMIGRAYHTIVYYRKLHGNKQKHAITDINLYNILLQAYASRGNWPKLKEVIDFIIKDKLKPTAKTYATIFECYQNCQYKSSNMEYLSEMFNNMKTESITIDEVLKESKSRLGQYNTVLNSIKIFEPDFIPKTDILNEKYENHLLSNINPRDAICQSPAEGLLKLNDLKNKFEVQIQNEKHGFVRIESIEKFDDKKSEVAAYYKSIIVNLENDWKIAALDGFERDLNALKNREHKPIPNVMALYPYLCVLNKEQYVDAILREIRKLANGSETFSQSFMSLCRRMGRYINNRYEILENEKNGYVKQTAKTYSKYCDWYLNRKTMMNSRIVWEELSNDVSHDFSLESQALQWPINLQMTVGKFLYGIILKDIKIDINYIKPGSNTKCLLPAFYTLFRSTNTKFLMEEIKPHPILSKIYRESQPTTLDFETELVPTICPPRPWSSIHSGGYILLKSEITRVPLYARQQRKRLESTPISQLRPSFDSLNQLSSIPWKVNKPILDLIIKIFRDGGSVELNVPQSPSVLTPVPLLEADSSESYRKSIAKARSEYKRKKNELYSLWCDALYRLSLANHFRDKIFWLPHNMDFRGRVYPIPPHLNHLGSDLARSILVFGLGKPLGPNGLDWLKIHTINLTGLKKRNSISERLQYANEILDEILDSARNPLDGKMWWAKSDEPWQTLAACTELDAALKSPNPENYVCHFPIHQDGSCNGLQHYAALGRDQSGAVSVNLYPSSTPQDVYSTVATMVEEIRQQEANQGNDVAIALEGIITRKVIKQTVMTTVYGVTQFGARLQIARQLNDLEKFPQEYVWNASLYLAQKTFASLRTMFTSAKQIQDWFTDCARFVSTLKGQHIEWVTPLGLPVIQPYSKMIPMKNGFHDTYIDAFEKPNTMKQRNAFAPNFVHSLDSCHMMLTSLHCEHHGLTFVSVHDCFWTHASTVDVMNKICREQFLALHSEPILENLSKFFIKKYVEKNESVNDDSDLEALLLDRKISYAVTKVPKKGDFDLKNVLKSVYFFS